MTHFLSKRVQFRKILDFFNIQKGTKAPVAPCLGGFRGGHVVMAPQSARILHKIDIFLDITRKQSNLYLEKFGLYYLVGSKEAKSDEFPEIGVPF